MAELAPCVAVIGPASSGKTTLLHLLDAELQDHPESPLAYVVKGNPDGSGRYLYYSRDLRNSQKGRWTDVTLDQVIEWVRNARRHLEIVLVDVGGSRDEKARPGNERLFKECDYYLALARTNVGPDDGMEKWIEDAKGANLKTFAELESHKERGDSSFDQVTKKGLFRGDDTPPNDPLNQSLSTKLTENLVQMRVRRTMPGYLDLRRRRRWRESELPSLGGALSRCNRQSQTLAKYYLAAWRPFSHTPQHCTTRWTYAKTRGFASSIPRSPAARSSYRSLARRKDSSLKNSSGWIGETATSWS